MKEYRKAKNIILLMILVCVISATGCGKTARDQATAAEPEFTIRVPLIINQEQEDFSMIQEEFSKIVQEKLGLSAELVYINMSSKRNLIRMYRKERNGFDLINFQLVGDDMYQENELRPLDDLLADYGEGILQLFSAEELEKGKRDGKIVWIPVRSDTVEGTCIMMRKDLLDAAGLSIRQRMSLSEVEEIFEIIAKENPKIKIVAPEGLHLNFLYRYYTWTNLVGSAIVAMDYGRSDQAEVLYETEEYYDLVSHFYDWRQKGWLPDCLGHIASSSLVKNGELFSYFVHYKPGIELQEGRQCGQEMQAVQITDCSVQGDRQFQSVGWAITGDSEYPREAMQILNLMYTDEEVMNLLHYGIEGVHYERNEDNRIVLKEESGYRMNSGWSLPNEFICLKQESDPDDLWAMIQENNESAVCGAAVGFIFDSSGWEDELSQIEKIESVYADGLASGALDPDIYLPVMRKEFEDAGVDLLLEEVQRQYDQWLSQKERGE